MLKTERAARIQEDNLAEDRTLGLTENIIFDCIMYMFENRTITVILYNMCL